MFFSEEGGEGKGGGEEGFLNQLSLVTARESREMVRMKE